MFAFHIPPMKGSSGLQRTLNFARDLPRHGWLPRIVSVQPTAYSATSDEQLGDIPSEVVVRRLPCLDVARHLSFRGRYPSSLALPDRWWTWLCSAVPAGLMECARWRPDALWATYPIPTAVLAGTMVAATSGKPLVIDLRDSMTEESFPQDRKLRVLLRLIERWGVRTAQSVVLTSSGTLRMYAERYPEIPRERWHLIANGYDEESFRIAERLPSATIAADRSRIRLVHSGLLDPVDRNPRAFFGALARFAQRSGIDAPRLQVTLRATGHDALYRAWIDSFGLTDVVHLAPAVPYTVALREMLDADGLLIFQAPNCNHQTPAKLYEYMRAGRPIFALTHRAGDTAATLREAGCPESFIAAIDDQEDIVDRLGKFLAELRLHRWRGVDPEYARRWRRAEQSALLAALLTRITTSG